MTVFTEWLRARIGPASNLKNNQKSNKVTRPSGKLAWPSAKWKRLSVGYTSLKR
jgi:hypothetical protein